MALSTSETEPLTVILNDTGERSAIVQLVRDVARTSSPDVMIVLATLRDITVPKNLTDRVRVARHKNAEALDGALMRQVSEKQVVLVCSSDTRLWPGWVDEVRARAASYPLHVSTIDGARGGVMLYPSSVRTSTAEVAPWRAPANISVPGAPTGSASQSATVLIAVHRESAELESSLRAAAPLSDQILVVDFAGSGAALAAVALRYGAEVVEASPSETPEGLRARAASKVVNPWVLLTDSREALLGDRAELEAYLDAQTCDHVSLVASVPVGTSGRLREDALLHRIFRRSRFPWGGSRERGPASPQGEEFAGFSAVPAPVRIELRENHLDRAEDIAGRGLFLLWAGEVQPGMAVLEELDGDLHPAPSAVLAGRLMAGVALRQGQVSKALRWIRVLERNGESSGNTALFRIKSALLAEDVDGALHHLEELVKADGPDPWGVEVENAQVLVAHAEIMHARGDAQQAKALLDTALAENAVVVPAKLAIEVFQASSSPLADLVSAAGEEFVAKSITEVAEIDPWVALEWCEALYTADSCRQQAVIAGDLFAAQADWATALLWSARAYETGLVGNNALQGLAGRGTAPVPERCIALGILAEVFGHPEAPDRLRTLLCALSDDTRAEVETVISQITRDLPRVPAHR